MPDPSIPVAIVAAAGALIAGATALNRPVVSFGTIFFLASLSRATLETPLGTMRPEMPAIAAVAAVLLVKGRFSALLHLERSTLVIALAFATYLGVLALSSAFVAPGTAQSMRMVAWLAISMLGGFVAFTLVRSRPLEAIGPLALAGALMGALGILLALLFLVVGPGFDLGIQDTRLVLPRVYALGWEANLYASFLAMCAFFAFEAARGPRKLAGLVMLALILIGFPLGVTRGAYIGLAAGALAYVVVRFAVERRATDLPRLAAFATALLVMGVAASNLLLPNELERAGTNGETASASAQPRASVSAAPASARPAATSTPAPVLSPTSDPYSDTLAFRLERVPIALSDLRNSPVIGFGAESFGQRHPDRYAGPGPDHIAIMAVAVPYEAGVIGAAALATGFAVLFASLWKFARRSNGDRPAVGAAAAFIGSLVSVLVAYQGNNALHLAINWLVIGAAAALAARAPGYTTASGG